MANELLKQVISGGLKENGLWYFAHPYTCYDDIPERYLIQEANFQLCLRRTIRLIESGWIIFSPIVQSHLVQSLSVQFLRHCRNDLMGLHKLMMNIDLTILHETNFCGLILAPRWEDSNGCNQEYKFFNDRDKLILNYNDLITPDV